MEFNVSNYLNGVFEGLENLFNDADKVGFQDGDLRKVLALFKMTKEREADEYAAIQDVKSQRESAKPVLAEIFSENPQAEFDPRQLAGRVGLENNQGNRSFIRYQLKQLRLTYQPNL